MLGCRSIITKHLGRVLLLNNRPYLWAQTQAHTIDGILLTKFDTIDDKVRACLVMGIILSTSLHSPE